MGKAESSQAEADHLSGRQEADRGGSESTVGEGEARRLMAQSRAMSHAAVGLEFAGPFSCAGTECFH